MKNIIVLLIIISSQIVTYSQTNSFVVEVLGEIINPNFKSVTISNENGYKKTIELNEEAEFSDTLVLNTSGIYSFSDGRESTLMYLDKKYVLNITIDTKQFDETIKYEGVGAENNNFLVKKYLINEQEIGDGYSLFAAEEEEFTKTQEDVNNKYFALLKELKDDKFVKFQTKDILYNYYLYISLYGDYHAYLSKNADFKVSKEFLKPLENIDYNIEFDYANFKSYKILVNQYYLKNINDAEKIDESIKKITAIESSVIKEGILTEVVNNELTSSNENTIDIYNALRKYCTTDANKTIVENKYNQLKKLLKGQPSPKFAYKDVNDKLVKLDDLKGNYVYIDVWATWCSPCLGEIPHLKKLEKDYHGKNIAFVSISVDNSKAYDKWKQMVKDKELEGYQLFADKSWASDFVKAYQIKGIPTFILIDPKGNIVSSSAMRPSNPELRKQFDLLLK